MNVYKLRPFDNGYQVIEKGAFETATLKKRPWYQKNERGEDVQYAVCPACNNPVQIIGLYRLPANVQRPFGRHAGHGVPDLAPLNVDERDNCLYFRPRPRKKSDRRAQMSEVSHQILQTLIEQFDRVMYIIRQQTGIVYSQNTARKMLETYRGERGYLYTGATLLNIPWIFAYMSDSQALFGQYLKNPAIIDAIRKEVPDAMVSAEGQLKSREKAFFSIDACFIHHRVSKDSEDGLLVENMKLVASSGQGDQAQVLHTQEIVFEHDWFQSLIQNVVDPTKRDMALVETARQVLGDLL